MEKPLLLGMNPASSSSEGVQRMRDQLYETGLIPGPNGACIKDSCGGQVVWRPWLEGSLYRPPPCCLRCGATYRATPSETWLPLLPSL